MADWFGVLRSLVYPRRDFDGRRADGYMRASSVILGMLGVAVGVLLTARFFAPVAALTARQ